MYAKLSEPRQNTVNWSGTKELTDSYTVVVSTAQGLKEAVDARCWMGRSNQASVVYAAIWIHGKDSFYTSGKGKAGGGGYHKASAAIQGAIESAGATLYRKRKRCTIDGVGDNAIREALTAITRALGYSGEILIVHR